MSLGTIPIFSGSIRPTTDFSYGDTGSRQLHELYQVPTSHFFSPITSCRLKMQNIAKKTLKKHQLWEKLDRFAHVSITNSPALGLDQT